MSLILSKLIFLILYLSSNYNSENIDEAFKHICDNLKPENGKNGFQSLVKSNFESFLCYLYTLYFLIHSYKNSMSLSFSTDFK